MRSSRLLLVLLLLLVVPAAGLGAWLLLRTEASVETASGYEAVAPRPAGRSADLQAPGAEPAALPEAGARESVQSDGADRATIPLENAHWVEVRVVLPTDTPLDEALTLVAFSPRTPWTDRPERDAWQARKIRERLHEASVEPDGSFRVAFAEDVAVGHVDVDARYLYLEQPLAVELPAEGPITLEPSLGGRLVARFELPAVLPADFDLERMEPSEVQLVGWELSGGSHVAMAELGPSLVLESGGLRADLTYYLRAELDDFADVHVPTLSFEPGRTLERSFSLVVGARISGRVVDEAGTPLEGANVGISSDVGGGLFSMGDSDNVLTQADGTFELGGVRPGTSTLTASSDGFLDAEPLELELTDREIVQGLELVLPSGERVTGRVTFPDGRPAAGAQVQLEEQTSRDTGRRRFVFDQNHEELTAADGRFSIAGLGAGPFTLRVQAEVLTDEAVGERVQRHERETWRSKADGVRPGAEVALVLEPPIVVRGLAVDDTGVPVTRFRVRAGDAEENNVPWRVVQSTDDNETESLDGSFEVHTLGRGTWKLSLEAEGHGPSEERTLSLPGETGPFTFVLPRAGSLAGRVIDAAGRPAAAAQVGLTRSGGVGGLQYWMGERVEAETDEEGGFRFEDVAPGMVELVARADDAAPSEALGVEVLAAAPIEGLELVLRLGGTLTGEVYNADGTVDAGRQVMVQQPISGEGGRGVTTDAAGRFRIEHLAPGRYQVAAFPDMDTVQAAEQDPVAMLEQMRMQSAEVLDGEVTHVVLGAPPAEPVALTGVVLEASRPAGNLVVVAFAEGSSMLSSLKSARTAADGSFAMTLPAPGDWILMAGDELDGEGSEFPITVPPGEGHHVELQLPTGRISGRVVAADGAPAASIQVSLTGGRTISIFNTSGGRETQSDENGRFHFERVRPGTYELRAGADAAAGFFGGEGQGYGIALLSGLELAEGGALDGLELHLSDPGTIRGIVRAADGSPAAEASVWVRDSIGRVLNTRSWCVTDSGGRFVFRGAGRGSYTVLARTDAAASQEVAVDVSEGLESEVELTLESGTMLVVAMEDEQGDALRAVLRVWDDAGREVSGLASVRDMERAVMEGFSTREQRIGPLPAGRYRVEAIAEDGARAAKPVKLSGQAERRLRLRLKD